LAARRGERIARTGRAGPPTVPGGMNGATGAQAAPVASLASLRPLRSYCGRVISVQAVVISVQSRNRIESHPTEISRLVSDQALGAAGDPETAGVDGR
jgi:hypothetical protein